MSASFDQRGKSDQESGAPLSNLPASTIAQIERESRVNDAIACLNKEIEDHYLATPVKSAAREFVLEYFRDAVSHAFVTGIIELEKAAGRADYQVDLQFYRCAGGKIPPVVATFTKSKSSDDGEAGTFGIPNIELQFDEPEYRIRGVKEGPPNVKHTKASSSSGLNDKDDGAAGPSSGLIKFENCRAPVRVIIEPSTDEQLHRPYDLKVQYSDEAFEVARRSMTLKLRIEDRNEFNHLNDSVLAEALREEMIDRFPMDFGERERAEVLPGAYWDEDRLHVTVKTPGYENLYDLDIAVTFTGHPRARAFVEEVYEVAREES